VKDPGVVQQPEPHEATEAGIADSAAEVKALGDLGGGSHPKPADPPHDLAIP